MPAHWKNYSIVSGGADINGVAFLLLVGFRSIATQPRYYRPKTKRQINAETATKGGNKGSASTICRQILRPLAGAFPVPRAGVNEGGGGSGPSSDSVSGVKRMGAAGDVDAENRCLPLVGPAVLWSEP